MTLLAPQPRYRQLAQTLINEIESGRYPVGGLLPTEFELCEQFGASRFTVREAIKQLVQLGLVDRQPGVGTRVKIAQPASEYRQVMQRLADLQQYSAQTELDVFHAKTVELDKELCQLVRGTLGRYGCAQKESVVWASGGPRSVSPSSIFIRRSARCRDWLAGGCERRFTR